MSGEPIRGFATGLCLVGKGMIEHLNLDTVRERWTGVGSALQALDRFRGGPYEDAGIAPGLKMHPVDSHFEIRVGFNRAKNANRKPRAVEVAVFPAPRIRPAVDVSEVIFVESLPTRLIEIVVRSRGFVLLRSRARGETKRDSEIERGRKGMFHSERIEATLKRNLMDGDWIPTSSRKSGVALSYCIRCASC